ncbi:baseplate J/gp47 family protein [Pseudomonas chlororaphis]|uniref:baseplate J/gp47 family protein n=3 Tax=Pseudomonas chlororaphis TaxID=587753 RepID=UPI001B31252F|nr:baseplate J/gp47 family protein [Pseudomonas chlororaphis]MBP5056333.1 baseplate J/gp47 family protein [Pseudomonas chlororaphis]QTT98509.1 baseplate J/gp47 family protein [Pseudomonas chlororaphis]
MAYTFPSLESILAGILRDIRNLQDEADIGTDSDHYIRSSAVAAAIEGLYQKIGWVYRQIFPDTADKEEVIHAAAIRGVLLKDAVAATGSVALTGAVGIQLLEGATLKHVVTGEPFAALSSATIGTDGAATVVVEAQTVGSALNDLTGDLVLTSPPLGMDSTATFVDPTTGGEDLEEVESLLARLLDIIQRPPAGGADYDYERWAKEVDGVTDALVLPKRRGAGTVDVVITAGAGLPSAEVIDSCLEYILSQCSVIADVWVYAPTIRPVNSTALVELASGYSLAEVQVAAQKAYDSLLGALKPREPLKRSQIEAMLSNLAGVVDRSVTTPTSNVVASSDPNLVGWIRPGTITLGLMT